MKIINVVLLSLLFLFLPSISYGKVTLLTHFGVDVTTGSYIEEGGEISLPGPFSASLKWVYNSDNKDINQKFTTGWSWEINSAVPTSTTNLIGCTYLQISYDQMKRLKELSIKSGSGQILGALYFSYEKLMTITSSNKDRWVFQLGESLEKVSFPNGKEIMYLYQSEPNHCLTAKKTNNGSFLYNYYDSHGRVIRQEAPHGINNQAVKVADYLYEKTSTLHIEPSGASTRTHFNPTNHLITSIETLGEDKTPSKIEHFLWDKENRLIETYLNEGFEGKSYSYDANSNLIKETTRGNLSGKNKLEAYSKYYQYKENQLLLEYEDNGNFTRYLYDKENRLYGQLLGKDNKIYERRKFIYNNEGFLIETHRDDGNNEVIDNNTHVTESYIEKYILNRQGMPEITEKILWTPAKQSLFQSYRREFSSTGALLKEEIIDEQENLISCKEKLKGNHGTDLYLDYREKNLGWQEKNESGNTLSSQNTIEHPLTKTIYDLAGRIISELKEENGIVLASSKLYNDSGNLELSREANGQETIYLYDKIGRLSKKIEPLVLDENKILYHPTTEWSYDAKDQITLVIDPSGSKTARQYTSRGDLSSVTFNDGTEEHYTYSLDGLLIETISRDGMITRFERDWKGRPLSTIQIDREEKIIRSQSVLYNAFHPLEQNEDHKELTRFTYYPSGRLAKEEISNEEGFFTKEYEYNEKGQVFCVHLEHEGVLEELIAHYDEIGRIQSIVNGNKILTPEKTSEPVSIYNDNFYVNERDQYVLKNVAIFSNGEMQVIIHDALGREEKIIFLSPFGEKLSENEIRYNREGEIANVLTKNYSLGVSQENIYEYDTRSRLTLVKQENNETLRINYSSLNGTPTLSNQKEINQENTLTAWDRAKEDFCPQGFLATDIGSPKGIVQQDSFLGSFGNDEKYPNLRISYINGINCTQNDFYTALRMISNSHGGCTIHFSYVCTNGITKDLLRSVYIKATAVTHEAQELVQVWKKLFENLGNNHKGLIFHYAHSLGGTITLRAREILSREDAARIRVITFGTASIIPNEHFHSVLNIVNRRDVITLFCDPWCFVKTTLKKQNHLLFFGSSLGLPSINKHLIESYWHYWVNDCWQEFEKYAS